MYFFLLPDRIKIELHGFCDASEAAYGAVIYCKAISATNRTSVRLVCSKSRVSPLKKTTIPRLELCAAVLLAKLMHRVKSSLKLELTAIHLWTDSMIVLSWINKEPTLLKTFVANRISKIQDLTEIAQWHHIASEENPSDLISRGMSAKTLQLS
ncbi:uncharacterized protein LOC118182259 [Stegodyphus dumicola]|uniref:uncharacterized protein LOC118182259 n=1 Tax=Stegodyphus dumicola TaxID=202533 RepID=UPI0015A8B5A2|nr:uncharacterized protein LOC118182259 [Stegodyphus dumicola]